MPGSTHLLSPPQERAAWISWPENYDLLELSEEATGFQSWWSTEGTASPCTPSTTSCAIPGGPAFGPGVLRALSAPAPQAGPPLPTRGTLGRPPPEASAWHLQCAQGLLHRELPLWECQGRAGVSMWASPTGRHTLQHRICGWVGHIPRLQKSLLHAELSNQGVLQLKSHPCLDPCILIRELGEGLFLHFWLEVSGYSKFGGPLGAGGT